MRAGPLERGCPAVPPRPSGRLPAVVARSDACTHAWADAKVPTELKLALQKARTAKGITQKALATVRATAPLLEGITRG